ncbi:hypothetical protein T01_11593 [Trichinella spiralis]|uniref:Uncharacterized protein n=1 Tax=Trichinella spiralis TaxID=6334 RepID=A0A0V1BGW5_TRISP|nr:hypothetical protein T01_11593 [Trichinella spiralis]
MTFLYLVNVYLWRVSLVLGLQSLLMVVAFLICSLFHEFLNFLKEKRMAAAHYTENNGPLTVFRRAAPRVVVGGIFHQSTHKQRGYIATFGQIDAVRKVIRSSSMVSATDMTMVL